MDKGFNAKYFRIGGLFAIISAICWTVNMLYVSSTMIYPKPLVTVTDGVATMSIGGFTLTQEPAIFLICAGLVIMGIGMLIKNQPIAAIGGMVYVVIDAILVVLHYRADLVYYHTISWMMLGLAVIAFGFLTSGGGKKYAWGVYLVPGFLGLLGFMAFFSWGLMILSYAAGEVFLWYGYQLGIAGAVFFGTLAFAPERKKPVTIADDDDDEDDTEEDEEA